MKFQLIGKTKAKLVNIDIQSAKRGQTETVPAVALTLKVPLPNSELDQLDKGLLPFLYEKGANPTQQTLDGVAVVSNMPSLTRAASCVGVLSWDGEQSGSTLIIYQGVTGDADIRLQDGIVTIKKIDPHEGGTWDATLSFYAEDLHADTLGELAVLKSHDLDIELTAPEVAQKQLDDEEQLEDEDENGNPFPFEADPQQTPEAAFTAAVTSDAKVTHKRTRLAAVGK